MTRTEKIEEIKSWIYSAFDKFYVVFEKSDGSDREMLCSKIALNNHWNKRLIEEEQSSEIIKEKPTNKVPEGNLLVMEVIEDGENQIRSIKLDKIKELSILSGDARHVIKYRSFMYD